MTVPTNYKEECILDRNDQSGKEGRLPAMAPLANPYVPFQLENPPKYEARKGIVRGTLFPGLELPFMGMVNNNELPVTPKTELQALSFAIQELALYLDTHRDDREALELYRTYQTLYHQGMKEYSVQCGPLNHTVPAEGEYRWLDDPWPWEFSANKEA
jgi:spore coat protein JB